MNAKTRKVAVVGGNRIPFARSNSAYSHASNQDMLTAALDGLIDRFGLAGRALGEVAGGAVLKHSRDRDLTRESVLSTRLAAETPAYDVQQACGTGLETTILVANKIALGQIDVRHRLRRRHHLRRADRPQRGPARDPARGQPRSARRSASCKPLTRVRPGHIVPAIPRNEEPRTGLSMGEHCAIMADRMGDRPRASRTSSRSPATSNLAAAYERGFLDDLITPYLGLERDQNLRPDSSLEKLAKLKPVFGGPEGTMTAANSTPLTDGASRRPARLRGVGEGARPADPRLHHRGADRRRRPRPQARRPADGAGLRDAADARPRRPRRCRTSTTTRSTRPSPRRCSAR